MKKSGVPAFYRAGIVWEAWIADDTTYVWRAKGHDMSVGRSGAYCWARFGNKLISSAFTRLVDAMTAAAEAERQAA